MGFSFSPFSLRPFHFLINCPIYYCVIGLENTPLPLASFKHYHKEKEKTVANTEEDDILLLAALLQLHIYMYCNI